MKNIVNKLLTVKSIVTLVFTVVFAYLALTGKVSGQEFLTIYTAIIGFYFGTQSEKKKEVEKDV